VYDTIKTLATEIRRKPQPILVEAMTFRMRGHEEASGTKYVPQELFDLWGKKDPVDNFEKFILRQKIMTQEEIDQLKKDIKEEINAGLEIAFNEPVPTPNTAEELHDVYRPFTQSVIAPTGGKSTKRYVDAISDALRQSMQRYPELVIMGQDVAEYGGVFKITEGFVDLFGRNRVRNTPLCESAIVGIGLGMSIKHQKSIVEMQFADFVTCGFNQIVNNLAKSYWRWGQHADVVVRMPTGAGVAAGPFHSQSNEAWFFHTPGLKIVYPSNPHDAKGLLNAAIEDPNPYLYFEHKFLYRSLSEDIPDEYYTIEIGKAKTVKEGSDLSIITYGMGVHWAVQAQEELPHLNMEIIDLRTLLPWDKEAVAASVQKTGRVLLLHEDCLTGGIGGELAAWIGEHCFEHLDAPVMREASLDTPVPFAASLEQNFLPKGRLKDKIERLANF
jgi:2-oxoisovalerate dehydrogenase E1 component